MSISAQDAINLLQTNPSAYATADALRSLANQISVEASGSVTVLYSGKMPDGSSTSTIIENMLANGKDVRVIDKSAVAEFLGSREFKSAVANAYGISLDDLLDNNFSHPAKDWLFDAKNGPWADASKRFAEATVGEVCVLAPMGDSTRVFAQTELPELLKNSKVTSIDGIPLSQLQEMQTSKGLAAVQQFTFDHARLKVELGGLPQGDYTKYLNLTPESYGVALKDPARYKAVNAMLDDMPEARRTLFKTSMTSAWDMGKLFTARGVSTVANKLGALGLLAGFMISANSAAAAEQSGNTEQAKEIMTLWATDSAGSALGEAAGAAIGGIALAALAVVGVTLSAPVAGALVLGATLIGGIFGGDAATGVYQLTKDLDDIGRMDLLDKLGNLVFGANYTLSSPLPADLDGDKLTLDTTFSREEIVASARGNIAWRYALRELNPFVIPDISYANHNTDGSLDLFDPVTGQGTMTELYLQDRAAMLTWKIRYDKGALDDDDSPHAGVKPYSEDWDTNAVDGNWDFVDIASATTLQIDGVGISMSDHQIVFGTKTADTLDGSGDSDHLYGGAGNDTLNGADGADYLEGNAGADTLTGGKDNDILQGGKDNDTYVFTRGDGSDTIIDSDGQGRIEIDGTPITHGKKLAEGSWLSDDEQTTFTLVSDGEGNNNLLINRVDGTNRITVRGWQANQLGITLDDLVTPPVTDTTWTGSALGDHVWGVRDATQLLGMGGVDVLYGSDKDDDIDGGDDGDLLAGFVGRDTLMGGNGDDIIYGANTTYSTIDFISTDPQFHTRLRVSDSAWTIDYSGYIGAYHDGVWVGDDTYTYDPAAPLPSDDGNLIDGGSGDDSILAGPGADVAHGGADNDAILGMADDDTLFGDAGNDYLFGDSTVDTANFSYTPADLHGADILDGGIGNDLLIGQGNDDELYGGAGQDALYGDDRKRGNTPDSVNGSDWLDGGADGDELFGGGRNDILIGGSGDDLLWGDTTNQMPGSPDYLAPAFHGDDYLDGGTGTDLLLGNGGDDTLYGGEGNDELQGDSSTDVLPGESHGTDYLDGGAGDDKLFGQGGADVLYGGDGKDELQGDADELPADQQGADRLDGGAGDDKLFGQGGNDTLWGGAGSDQLEGEAGDDTLDGGAGADFLFGGDGNDTLRGSGGAVLGAGDLYSGGDVLQGGAGDDTYYATTGDLIIDTQGNNTLVLTGNAADVVMRPTTVGLPALAVESGGQTIFIQDGLTSPAVSRYQFANGSTMAHADLVGQALFTPVNLSAASGAAYGGRENDTLSAVAGVDATLSGGGGNDLLTGNTGNDTLDGGAGNDDLFGGAGSDTYTLSTGSGQDVIDNTDASMGKTDRLAIGGGLVAGDLTFRRVGNDLIVRIMASGDQVTVQGHYAAENRGLSPIVLPIVPQTLPMAITANADQLKRAA